MDCICIVFLNNLIVQFDNNNKKKKKKNHDVIGTKNVFQ